MKSALFLAAIAAYLFQTLFPRLPLDGVVSAICALIVVVVFFSIKPFVRILGGSFLAIGCALFAAYGASWDSYLLSFGSMLDILSLFALVPFVAIPIQLGRYADRVRTIIRRRVRHSGALYAITSAMSYSFSSFMSVAALPMVYHTIRSSVDLYPIAYKERFLSRAVTHGFAMPLVWTPVTPMVGMVVEMTGARWTALLPIVIPLSVLGLVLDGVTGLWLSNRRRRQIEREAMQEMAAARESGAEGDTEETRGKHPVQVLVVIFAFNLVISALEHYTDLSFLVLVTLAVIPFAFVWAALIGKTREFAARGRAALPDQLLKMKDQFFVFLSAGFMIAAFQATGADRVVSLRLNEFKDIVGPELFLCLIPLLPFVLAFVGIHPAVALAIAAGSLQPDTLGIPVEPIAVAMLLGAAGSFLVGPYNATIAIMSSLVDRSTYRVSNWNLPFASVFLLLSMIALFFIQ
ncbi:hypothetical protein FE782_04885 [Paenibacillus antri]|uniref:DUF401 family protein n=1 Tax=Paenibacillus antri TaxID=2582848 RepID=A0A5R9GHD5_9BACL|nr:hypothetical protein [Paenibacillus antri]TLS53610.1 hypothetical protein FE782_04885 [Paenibacillus antri]